MNTTELLYQRALPIWEGYHCHPFVTGIGDGTLPLEKFRYFLLQDYLYLFDYARVFALGVAKAQDHSLMQLFAQNLDHILNGEMNLHRAYMTRLGLSQAQVDGVRMAHTNRSYTSYMLSVAYAQGPVELLGAILACSWSYAEIGARLAARPGAAEHPFYGEWIQGYACAAYAQSNESLLHLTNTLTQDWTGDRLEGFTDIFVRCSQYEADFWNMAWTMEA